MVGKPREDTPRDRLVGRGGGIDVQGLGVDRIGPENALAERAGLVEVAGVVFQAVRSRGDDTALADTALGVGAGAGAGVAALATDGWGELERRRKKTG